MRRLNLHRFNGEDLEGWLMEAEKRLMLYLLSEEDKIEAAVVFLDGEALLWYQWDDQQNPIKDWQDLKSLLLRKFKLSDVGDHYEHQMTVDQGGKMADCR